MQCRRSWTTSAGSPSWSESSASSFTFSSAPGAAGVAASDPNTLKGNRPSFAAGPGSCSSGGATGGCTASSPGRWSSLPIRFVSVFSILTSIPRIISAFSWSCRSLIAFALASCLSCFSSAVSSALGRTSVLRGTVSFAGGSSGGGSSAEGSSAGGTVSSLPWRGLQAIGATCSAIFLKKPKVKSQRILSCQVCCRVTCNYIIAQMKFPQFKLHFEKTVPTFMKSVLLWRSMNFVLLWRALNYTDLSPAPLKSSLGSQTISSKESSWSKLVQPGSKCGVEGTMWFMFGVSITINRCPKVTGAFLFTQVTCPTLFFQDFS